MEIHHKIRQAREELSQTQTQFAVNVGATQKDVSKLEQGAKKFIPNEYIDYLISVGYDINTLFDGTSDLKKRSAVVNETAILYHSKTRDFVKEQQIPLYNIEAIAGITPIFQDLHLLKPIDFIHIPNAPESDGAIYAKGDSMYPIIKSSDILCFKTIKDIENGIFWGKTYILDLCLTDDDLLTTKYIKKGKDREHIILVSENKHYEDKEIHLSKIRGLALVKMIVKLT